MAPDPPWPVWVERWQLALEAARAHSATACGLTYERPASVTEVEDVERQLGSRIPEQFRQTLLGFSRSVRFFWSLPATEKPPGALAGVWFGGCRWDLDAIVRHNAEVVWLSRNAFIEDTPDERCWQSKFAFHPIDTGDFIAIDTSSAAGQRVVYLSHELFYSHQHCLGADFFDFMDRWTLLGCPDDDIWPLFVPERDRYVDLSAENARQWLRWFGLPPVPD
jgi:hypothetical protein